MSTGGGALVELMLMPLLRRRANPDNDDDDEDEEDGGGCALVLDEPAVGTSRDAGARVSVAADLAELDPNADADAADFVVAEVGAVAELLLLLLCVDSELREFAPLGLGSHRPCVLPLLPLL